MRHWHTLATRRGAPLVAATLVGACSSLFGPDRATDADLDLAAAVSRAEVAGGDTATVTVVIRNPTWRAVRLSDQPCPSRT